MVKEQLVLHSAVNAVGTVKPQLVELVQVTVDLSGRVHGGDRAVS